MYGLDDPRKLTKKTLPSGVLAEADFLLEETGDGTGLYKVTKSPAAKAEVKASVSVQLTTALSAGDIFYLAGRRIGAYAGVTNDPYGINVSTANTIALQITALKAMAFPEFTISGAADTITLTQKVGGVSTMVKANKAGLSKGVAVVTTVVWSPAVVDLTNQVTSRPYRFAEDHPKTLILGFNGLLERGNWTPKTISV